MEENKEDLDSQNQESDENQNEEDTSQKSEELSQEQIAELKEKAEVSSQNFERAKKSETEVKELREQLKKLSGKTEEIIDNKPSEPDYAKLAFLKAEGVIHPDDQKIVQDEAARLKLPLTDVLQMQHIKGQLETNKTERETAAGMPKGRGQAGGTTQNDVDYWLAKGETPDDLELAEKVINARMAKDDSQKMFDPIEK